MLEVEVEVEVEVAAVEGAMAVTRENSQLGGKVWRRRSKNGNI